MKRMIALAGMAWILTIGMNAQTIVKPSVKTKTTFAIVTDTKSYEEAKEEIDAYRTSVEKEGLGTYLIVDDWKTPQPIRELLIQLHADKKAPLEGCVFLGDIPIPMLRDSEHLCSAFKAANKKNWYKSSVPSDRYYDDFDLMEGGGHISGWLLQGEAVASVNEAIAAYEADVLAKFEASGKVPMTYAVGDGNHSLATAKACYEELKAKEGAEKVANHPARFALVELENIYDEAQVFEPIHRLLTNVDVNGLLEYLQTEIGGKGTAVKWFANGQAGELSINDENGELPLEVIQIALDKYLKANTGEIDYIHGDETLEQLSQKENTIGFLMPNVTKNAFFENIVNNGVMPRKTFSMGEAEEKRYYLEGRRII